MQTKKVETYILEALKDISGVRMCRDNSLLVDASKKVLFNGKVAVVRKTKSIRIGLDGTLSDAENILRFKSALREALRCKDVIKNEIATNGYLAVNNQGKIGDITLQGIWDRFSQNLFSGVLNNGRSFTDTNIEHVSQYFDDLVEFFGKDKKLNQISLIEVDKFKEWLRHKSANRATNGLGTVSNGTINKRLGVLRNLLRLALRYRYLTLDDCIDGSKSNLGINDLPRDVVKEKPAMMYEEQQHLLRTIRKCGDNYFADMIEIAFELGMRHSCELNMFTVKDVNYNHKLITFWRSKTRTWSIPIPLSNRAYEILCNYRESALRNGGKFFPMSKGKLRHYWHKYRTLAGFDKTFTPYITRGSYITRLVEGGIDPKTVQKLAGHTCIETTLGYYTKPTKQGLERVRDVLNLPATKQVKS